MSCTLRVYHSNNSSGKGHKHPVYSMCLARQSSGSGRGSHGAAASSATGSSGDWVLITASTDGLLCHWDLDNLTEPVSSTLMSSSVILPSIGAISGGGGHTELSASGGVSSGEDLGVGKASSGGGQGGERPVSVSCMALGPEEGEEGRKVRTQTGKKEREHTDLFI